jgi:YD repeat-containing protein
MLGHVKSRSAGGETTNFSYYPTGLLEQVTLPDGGSLSYTYDAAHRLTQVSDGLGNKIVYTLDAMGNRRNTILASRTKDIGHQMTRSTSPILLESNRNLKILSMAMSAPVQGRPARFAESPAAWDCSKAPML